MLSQTLGEYEDTICSETLALKLDSESGLPKECQSTDVELKVLDLKFSIGLVKSMNGAS